MMMQPNFFGAKCAGFTACLVLAWSLLTAVQAQTVQLLGDGALASSFVAEGLEDIPKHTIYRWVADEGGTGKVLDAYAQAAAAAYVSRAALPFNATTTVEITYRVVVAHNPAAEQSKAGDDFALRLYLIGYDFPFYKTLVLVHSLQHEEGASWLNPYSSALAQFNMHVIAGKESALGVWRTVTIDAGRIYGETYAKVPTTIDGVGIMVDSDNSAGLMHTQIREIVYYP